MNEEIIVKIGADISGLSADLKRAQANISGLGETVEGIEDSGSKASLGIGKIVTAIGLVALAAGAFTLIKDSIGQAFGRIDTMEQFDRVMTTMTGSSEKANEVLDKTNEIVKGTAYGLDVGAKAVQNFVTSNMDVDKATDTVAAWGDAVAFYGDGSNESFASVSDALSKMTAKGKVQMDTMNRLTEAGIPAMQIYADATGQSVESVADLMADGALDAGKFTDVMNEALTNGTKNFEGIGGAAKEAGASWGGSFANMRAAIARGTTAIIENIDGMLADNGLPSMRDMIADFGSKFEDVMKAVADSIPPIVDAFKSVYKAIEPWMPLIKPLAIGIVTFVAAVATMNSVVAMFKLVRIAVTAMNTAFWANPVALVIGAIIAAAVLIYIYWEPISKFFIDLWEVIKSAGIAIWDALKSAWSSTIDWIKNAWNSVTVFFSALWKIIKSGAIRLWDSVVSAWESTVVWVKGIWDTVAEFFVGLWEGIVSVAISVWDTVSAAWETSIEYLKTLFEPMINFFTETWETIAESASTVWETISETLSVVWDNIKIIAESAWEIIKNVILGPILLLIDLLTGNFEGFQEHLSQIWENISIAAGTIWESIKTIVTTIVDAAIAFISLAWESSMAFISGLWEALKETASNIWTALSSAVSSIVSSLVSTVSSLWGNLRAAITKTVEAIKTAVNSAWKWIQTTSSTVFNAVKSTITSIWNGIKTFFTVTLGEIWTTVKQKFEDMKNSISEKMNEAWDKIVEIWDGVMAFFRDIDLLQIGEDIIDGLIKGIKSKVDAVGKAVTDVTSAITGKIKGILGIKSPSRVLAQIGRWTGEGLAQGIAGEEANVARAAQGLADASIVAAPTMSYATPNANYGSLSAALSGEVNVNQRDSMLIGAIASLEDKLTNLRVDLDGQRVGQMVTPHVNGANATDDLTRYF